MFDTAPTLMIQILSKRSIHFPSMLLAMDIKWSVEMETGRVVRNKRMKSGSYRVCYGSAVMESVMDNNGLVAIFGLHNRTAAYRFVTLVDVIYENKARLMCTAEGAPFQLSVSIVTISDAQSRAPRTSFRSRKNDDYGLCIDNELGFAKDRSISIIR